MFLWQAFSDYMRQSADIPLGDLETNQKLLDLIKAGNKEAVSSLNSKLIEQYLNDFELFEKNFAFLKRKDVNLLPILRKGFLTEGIETPPPGAIRINPFIKDIISSLVDVENDEKVNWLKISIRSCNYTLSIWLIKNLHPDINSDFSILVEIYSKAPSTIYSHRLVEIAELLVKQAASFRNLSFENRENFLKEEKRQSSVRFKPKKIVSRSKVESKESPQVQKEKVVKVRLKK